MSSAHEELDQSEFEALIERVGAAKLPAYLKSGELRFQAVSGPYAVERGMLPGALVGQGDPGREEEGYDRARDEAERRCLVFGKSQRLAGSARDRAGGQMIFHRIRGPRGALHVLAHDPRIDLQLRAEAPVEDKPCDDGTGVVTPTETRNKELEDAIQAMPMGVVLTDRDLTIELVNGPFFDIWKLMRREDLVGRNFRALMDINRHNGIYDVEDTDWETYVARRLEEIAKGGVAPRPFRRADGVALMYSVTPISDGRRMICYYDISDLEEQKRKADEASQETTRTLRLLDDAAEAMAQGLMIYDQESVIYTNRRFHEFLDVPRDKVAPGLPWTNLIDYCAARGDYGPPEAAAKASAYIRDCAAKGIVHQMERRGREGRWLRIDGKPTAGGLTVVTYSDISELKSREADLEALVVKAEASDRAKSEFLANMSHEIRTPMNGVLGMAELLSKTDLDTRQRTYCDIIVKSGNALLTIINDILDFSKIEAGEITLDSQPFDLRDAVEDIASLMATGAREKDLELAVSIPPELPQAVIGDVGRFRQVLTNLVGNAVKFTEKGHVLVSIDGAVSDETLALTIRVEDTGLGIPADKVSAIFEKFSQVDGSSTRRHEGTGLGLAITQRLVALMKGEITVDSEEGRGSVFTLSLALPVHKAAAPARPEAAELAGTRILVVDDNAVNRDILQTQLSARGCDVCATIDAAEGLAFLRAAAGIGVTVDCVILDHHMPCMTGLEMAAEIRRDPQLATTPLVLLTSVDVDPLSSDITALGLAAWLTKPAREHLLLETLARAIAGKPTGALATANETASHAEPRSPAEQDESLDLWIDDERLAESVAGIGAALWADDEADHGEHAHTDRDMGRKAQSAGRPVSPRARQNVDILVAEDNEVNQIVFSQILDDLGVVYRLVDNGASAVEAYANMAPRLILMDVSMPVMNGHEAARSIRQKESAADRRVPIIGVTAHALKGDREACLEAGMDDYLSKPISPEALEKKIRQWLDIDALAARAG
ncbi:response regulator [Pararhizobium haloflavum]|uniref:response regulator n=1 Tax=Pararhizobium haloflavum TaxID=2037914 RepID=UPI0012FFE24A|nr:response regulator [Pararhizobium haloflavum]